MDPAPVIPVAAPVALAGAMYLIPALRLRDLAALQGVAAARRAVPARGAGPAIDRASGRGRRVLAARACLACEAWPVPFGSEAEAAYWRSRRRGPRLPRRRDGAGVARPFEKDLRAGSRLRTPRAGVPPRRAGVGAAGRAGGDPRAGRRRRGQGAGPFNWARRSPSWPPRRVDLERIGGLDASQSKAVRAGARAGPPRTGSRPARRVAGRTAAAAIFAEAEALGR